MRLGGTRAATTVRCIRPSRRLRPTAADTIGDLAVGAGLSWARDCEECSSIAATARFVHGFQDEHLSSLDVLIVPSRPVGSRARSAMAFTFPKLHFSADSDATTAPALSSGATALAAADINVLDAAGSDRFFALAHSEELEVGAGDAHTFASQDVAAAESSFDRSPELWRATVDPSTAWFGWPLISRLLLNRSVERKPPIATLGQSSMAALCLWAVQPDGALVCERHQAAVTARARQMVARPSRWSEAERSVTAAALRRVVREPCAVALHLALGSGLVDPCWRLVWAVDRYTMTGCPHAFAAAVKAATDVAVVAAFDWRATPPIDRSLRLAFTTASLVVFSRAASDSSAQAAIASAERHAVECVSHWVAAAANENWVPTDALGLKAAMATYSSRWPSVPVVECNPARACEIAKAAASLLDLGQLIIRPRAGQVASNFVLRSLKRPVTFDDAAQVVALLESG